MHINPRYFPVNFVRGILSPRPEEDQLQNSHLIALDLLQCTVQAQRRSKRAAGKCFMLVMPMPGPECSIEL